MRGVNLLIGAVSVLLVVGYAPDAVTQEPAANGPEQIQLLTLGSFHHDEVQAEDGEEWWAAMRTRTGLVLRPVRIRVQTVFDPIADAEGEATGKEVSLAEPVDDDTCVFLVKGLADASERPISTLFEGYLFVFPKQDVLFGSGAHRIGLASRAAKNADGTVSYELQARTLPRETGVGKMSKPQTLYSVSGMHEGPPFDGSCGVVEWIGDLDGDGRWDFIVNQTNHYNVNEPTLFLSTLAEEGEIAGRAATFRTVGC